MNSFDPEWFLKSLAVHVMTTGDRRRYGFRYNPLSMRTIQNPYPVYDRIRQTARAFVARGLHDNTILTHHADVHAFSSQDNLLSHDPAKFGLKDSRASDPDNKSLFSLDPPEHTRLRKLVTKAFTPLNIRAFEPQIRRTAHELLDAVNDPSSFDFIRSFALPLPIHTIAIMLGVPREDYDKFTAWTLARARFVEPILNSRERRAADRAGQELFNYFRPIVRDRKVNPQADIVTELARAEEEGDKLTEHEVLGLLRQLLVTGSETTVSLLGNGLLALMRHSDQQEQLGRQFELIPRAVEEMLRYDAPVQLSIRMAHEDCTINGLTVKSRQRFLIMLGAANRDPAAFPEPGRFDIHRKMDAGIMSFGGGIHYCLGATLARMEARIAFEVLYERFAAFRLLTDRPKYRRGLNLRSLESLPVRATLA